MHGSFSPQRDAPARPQPSISCCSQPHSGHLIPSSQSCALIIMKTEQVESQSWPCERCWCW
ncbi:hypothetical protein BKA81DRAFT_373358 [Phyllosticta paracitricarpa]